MCFHSEEESDGNRRIGSRSERCASHTAGVKEKWIGASLVGIRCVWVSAQRLELDDEGYCQSGVSLCAETRRSAGGNVRFARSEARVTW